MANKYAANTTVTAQRTQAEIISLLMARGVDKTATMATGEEYTLAFELRGVSYKIVLPLPDRSEFRRTPTGLWRDDDVLDKVYAQEINRRWRSFGMVIKAKIVACEDGISTMEREFFGNAILRDGRTVAETYGDNMPMLNVSPGLKALGGGDE